MYDSCVCELALCTLCYTDLRLVASSSTLIPEISILNFPNHTPRVQVSKMSGHLIYRVIGDKNQDVLFHGSHCSRLPIVRQEL